MSKPLPGLVSPGLPIHGSKDVSSIVEKEIVSHQGELGLNLSVPMTSARMSNQRSVINSSPVTAADQNIGKNSHFICLFGTKKFDVMSRVQFKN